MRDEQEHPEQWQIERDQQLERIDETAARFVHPYIPIFKIEDPFYGFRRLWELAEQKEDLEGLTAEEVERRSDSLDALLDWYDETDQGKHVEVGFTPDVFGRLKAYAKSHGIRRSEISSLVNDLIQQQLDLLEENPNDE